MRAEQFFEREISYLEDVFACHIEYKINEYESNDFEGDTDFELVCESISFNFGKKTYTIETPNLILATCYETGEWLDAKDTKSVDEYALGAYIGSKIDFDVPEHYDASDLIAEPFNDDNKAKLKEMNKRDYD